jgi:peroxiredoxin
MDINNLTLPQAPFDPVDTTELFKDKKVILFGLPGAFTPTCSTKQLPGYEEMFSKFQEKGIHEIYCVSVNDAFVMSKWFKDQEVLNVKWLADGSGLLTDRLGMLCKKDNLGFGVRSWRYACVINNGIVEQMFAEEGKCDNHTEDPYDISSPENVYEKL